MAQINDVGAGVQVENDTRVPAGPVTSVLDFSHLGELADDHEFIQQLMHSFMASFADAGERLMQHLRAGELESARQLVHALKGAVGNIGGEALYGACAALESELKHGAYSPGTLDGVLESLARATAACISLIESNR